MEYRTGKGMILFCQMDVTGRTDSDPAAETLARNIVRYASARKPAPNRSALYAGDPAGQEYLRSAGIETHPYQGGRLSAGQVLIVGPGGGQTLAADRAAIASWLAVGGYLLAVGLDAADANAFLPFAVQTKRAEYI